MGSLKTVAGVKLWVEDSGAQANSKGTVLLLHGFPDTSSLWKQQISALNAAGYRTIAPDLPGLGRSEAPGDVSKYSIQSSITPAMLALLDEVSVDKVTVVGHDFGSGVAMTLAFMAPARVERLVVLSVGFTGSYFTAQPWEQRTISWYMPFILLPGSEDAMRANNWSMFRLFVGRDGSEEQVNEYIARFVQDPDTLNKLLLDFLASN